MEGKLDIFGNEYLKAFREELDIREEGGLYKVSGTDASGKPVSTTLTTEDLNSTKGTNFNYVLGVVNDKQNARKTEPGHQETPILTPEDLAKEQNRRAREMGILLDIVNDPDKYMDDPETEE